MELNPWATVGDGDDDADDDKNEPLDDWEAARHDKERRDRAVPPQRLDALLDHCNHVVHEIWPETGDDKDGSSGFDPLPDLAALLVQLLPANSSLPPAVPFSATATAKAMNDALKLTRHFPASASSPLSRLLASKGSLQWANSIRAQQDVLPDTTPHVGWRVLDKQDRLDESKAKKPPGGLLSFWNRRVSTVEPSRERSTSPGLDAPPHPPPSPPASPPPPPPTAVALAPLPPPSVVSRFFNRFARTKSTQHTALALSSDDLEFLSDFVPSAADPLDPDRGVDLTSTNNSNLPPKLPLPIPPPPRQSSRPSSAFGIGDIMNMNTSTPASQVHLSSVPVLVPPPSPKPAASFSPTSLSLRDVQTQSIALGRTTQASPSQKVPPLLSIPPLLPPPPTSPPQTPRPSAFPSMTTSAPSSAIQSTDVSAFHDSYDSDEEFSAFKSFPPSAPTPFTPADPYSSQRSPSPPSPPPRRTYERTHYPSSSSASSMFSPASQASVDQLCPSKSSVSASWDGFDDFVSPPSLAQGDVEKRTPSPPPLPAKPQSRPQQPPRVNVVPSRVHHAHTPSLTTTSPTVHTRLMHSKTVSVTEHRRTQSLVDQAAARGGLMWPDSPPSNAAKLRAIPPPPMSSKTLIEQDGFDLLGDGDALDSGLETLPPLSAGGRVGMDFTLSTTNFGLASGLGNGLGLTSQLQPSPPPSSSTPMPVALSFSALDPLVPSTRSQQSGKPKQTGGLSAQDLSFFEGL